MKEKNFFSNDLKLLISATGALQFHHIQATAMPNPVAVTFFRWDPLCLGSRYKSGTYVFLFSNIVTNSQNISSTYSL